MDVVIDANFVMTFDEPVAAGSGNVEIRETVGDALFESIDITGGQVTVVGDTVTVNPIGTLAHARGYYLLMDAGAITDQASTPNEFAGIADATAWSVTTVAAPSPPTVAGLAPADDAVDVVIDANLVMTFDEPVAAGAGNIEIRETVGDALFESIDITSGQVTVVGDTVTVNPIGTLAHARGYYLLMDAGAITDQEANQADFAGIGDTTTWNFTTVVEITPPTITGLAPPDDAADVVIDANFVMTFDEPVAAGSGNVEIRETVGDALFESIDITSGQVTVLGNTVTVDPNGTLGYARGYYLLMDAGAITDQEANPSDFAGSETRPRGTSRGNPTITARATDGGGNTGHDLDRDQRGQPFCGGHENRQRGGRWCGDGDYDHARSQHRGKRPGGGSCTPNGNQRVTDANGPSAFSEEIDEVGAGTKRSRGLQPDREHIRAGHLSVDDSSIESMVGGDSGVPERRYLRYLGRGAISGDPGSGQGTTATAPSMTTGTDGALGILFAFSDTASRTSAIQPMATATSWKGRPRAQASYIRAWPLAGATGPASVTLSSDDWMVYQLALRPIVLDTTPPVVTSFDPVDDAVKVAIDANLVVRFDENVAAGSGNIVITETSGGVFETVNVTSGQVTIVDDTVYSYSRRCRRLHRRGHQRPPGHYRCHGLEPCDPRREHASCGHKSRSGGWRGGCGHQCEPGGEV